MRYLKTLGLVALSVVAMAVVAGGASATVLTSPAGTMVEAGTEIKAESSGIELDGAIDIKCKNSTIEGEISNAGGSGKTVSGQVDKLTLTECGSDTVSVLKGGSLELHATSNGNGTLTSTGAEITVQLHRVIFFVPVTTHCIYKTSETHIGTFTGSATTKGTATLDINSLLPQKSTDGQCGENAELTGSYKFTSPDYIDADIENPGTILTSPAGAMVEAGTKVKAESESAISLDGAIDILCQKSTVEGEISNAGGSETPVSGPISKLTLTECGNDTVSVLKGGSLELHATSGGNGTLISTGAEITVQLHRVIFFVPITTHCIYVTNDTRIGTFTGSAATKGTATLDISRVRIPQESTDGACGENAELTGSYKFTSPDYLDADVAPSSVLTSPAGAKPGVGTSFKAESEGAIEFAGTVPISCHKSAMEGEISNAGGKEATASASLSSLSFSECGNHTVTVLKPGTLEIHTLGGGKGTLTSTGAEITVLTHGVFLGTRHCIYTTNETDIGTFTGSSVTGATAKLDIGPVATPQTATDGNCGSAEWGGSYKVSSPDYLDVD